MERKTAPEVLAAHAEVLAVLLGAVAGTIGLMVVATTAYWMLQGADSGRSVQALLTDPTMIAAGMGIQAVVFAGVGLTMIRLRVRPRVAISSPSSAALVGGIGGVAAFLGSALLGTILEWLGVPVTEQPILEELLSDPANLRRMAPWIVVVAPIAEEVFFRGYLMRFVAQRVSFPAGVILSTVLFAAIHMNLAGFPIYLLVGVLFALVYARTGSLLAPILAHVTYNGILLALIYLSPPA